MSELGVVIVFLAALYGFSGGPKESTRQTFGAIICSMFGHKYWETPHGTYKNCHRCNQIVLNTDMAGEKKGTILYKGGRKS